MPPPLSTDPFSCFRMTSRSGFAVRLVALIVLGAPLVAGCGGGGAVTADSAEEAFTRAQDALEHRKFDRAIELFRTTLDFGRTGEVADDAQLGLARAYAGSKQYLLAGAEFTRFIDLYRADPRIEDAAYERILAYAALSPTYELDQTDTITAIQYIDGFLSQYPTGAHALEASELRGTLREKLAHKQYEEGRLYERRELYEAAVLSYNGLLAEYPSSPYADDALFGAVRAQVLYADNSVPDRQEARYREALGLYDQLTSLFPQSPTLGEAQALYDRAFQGAQAAAARAAPVVVPTATASGQ